MIITREHIEQTVNHIITQRGKAVEAVIPILEDTQDHYNSRPEEDLRSLC